ncbi:hypothetical protein [Streptomyces sp. MK5]|nr:hypothetical protein [Streptomyces sp. MK5]
MTDRSPPLRDAHSAIVAYTVIGQYVQTPLRASVTVPYGRKPYPRR